VGTEENNRCDNCIGQADGQGQICIKVEYRLEISCNNNYSEKKNASQNKFDLCNLASHGSISLLMVATDLLFIQYPYAQKHTRFHDQLTMETPARQQKGQQGHFTHINSLLLNKAIRYSGYFPVGIGKKTNGLIYNSTRGKHISKMCFFDTQ
jgi:hypothetical protein